MVDSSFYWNHGANPLERGSSATAAVTGSILYFDGTKYDNIPIGTILGVGATSGITDLDLGNNLGSAGSLDVYAATALRGKVRISCVDNVGNFTVGINNQAHAQTSTYRLADSGLSAAFFAVSTAALDPTEVDKLDVSAQTETIAAAGAINPATIYTKLALVGAGAVTLAAPDAGMLGREKIIQMTADNGDVTLALTNVVGQSSGTTATFNDVRDTLVLTALTDRWLVKKEFGLSLA